MANTTASAGNPPTVRQRRKILLIVENAAYETDPRVQNEVAALAAADYQVTVICPRDSRAPGVRPPEGVRVYHHWSPSADGGRGGYLLEYLAALAQELALAVWVSLRHGFRVIQGCNPPDTICLVAAPFKLFGVRYIFDHHDAAPELYEAKYEKRGFAYRMQVALERLTYRLSDVVMATNESYRQLAITRGHRSPDQVFVVRNAPDPRRVFPVPENPAWRFGKRFMVGYVGSMGEQDGLDLLLQVAARFKARGRRDTHFTLVGGGRTLSQLKAAVAAAGLGDLVTFAGRLPDREMLEVLSTADICVNPDKPCRMNDISTMIKIMEYMALGKPIVQFQSTEGRVSAGEASLYADPARGVEDFADKLAWLLDHPEERLRMGAVGRRRLDDSLAWKYSVPHLLAAYDRAFTGHSSRPASQADGVAVGVGAGSGKTSAPHSAHESAAR
jgi:glycosyltransferase involved in cell wall biosynthesis